MPHVTANFCRQERNESLADVPRYGDGPRQVRITHVLNPYRARTEHERALQELTFETVRIAARVAAPAIEVRCVCVTQPNETGIVPPDFIAAETLTRTVLDVATFNVPRAMPLIFDVLDRGVGVIENPPELSGCEDFIVFTNMDIHLQPYFYRVIAEFINAGYDMIDVHRRIIPHYAPTLDQLPSMFAESGLHHGGLDCIVFPRQKYQSFVKNHACIGMSLVMKGVLFNCAMQARRFLVLSNSRLTFHLGNDRAWSNPRFKDYENFNFSESIRVVSAISKDKAAAVKLISALQPLGLRPEFIWTAKKVAGIESPKLTPRQLVLRKIDSIRRRLVRKAHALIAGPESQEI